MFAFCILHALLKYLSLFWIHRALLLQAPVTSSPARLICIFIFCIFYLACLYFCIFYFLSNVHLLVQFAYVSIMAAMASNPAEHRIQSH